MVNPTLQSKTTVRRYGSIEVWYLPTAKTYEITVTYKPAERSPPSEFAESLEEAMKIQADFLMRLILLKQIVESAPK